MDTRPVSSPSPRLNSMHSLGSFEHQGGWGIHILTNTMCSAFWRKLRTVGIRISLSASLPFAPAHNGPGVPAFRSQGIKASVTGHLRFHLALTFHEKPWRWEITPGKSVCPPLGPKVTRSQRPFSRRAWLRARPAPAGTEGWGCAATATQLPPLPPQPRPPQHRVCTQIRTALPGGLRVAQRPRQRRGGGAETAVTWSEQTGSTPPLNPAPSPEGHPLQRVILPSRTPSEAWHPSRAHGTVSWGWLCCLQVPRQFTSVPSGLGSVVLLES